jgi:hypothetical protein
VLISYRASASSTTNPLGEAFLPKVYDGEFREISDIRVERVVHALGSEPSRAEFSAILDSYHRWKDGQGNVHEGVRGFEQAVPPGSLGVGMDDVVIVGIPLGGGRVLVIFRGRVSDVDVSFSEGGESARLTALDPRRTLDNTDLRGARYADAEGGILATDDCLVFNPDNLGNYDKSGSETAGQPLFTDPVEPDDEEEDPYENHWRLGEFWRYVIGNFAPGDDSRLPSGSTVPELSDSDDAVLPPTDVDGMRPSEAITRVLGSYGLDWWADPFVVVNRWSVWGDPPLPCFRIIPPQSAVVKCVSLQPRGEDFSSFATNVHAGVMTFTTRGSVNHWRIEGDFKEYEACFELKKLWDAEEETQVLDNPNRGNRAHESYEISLDHVFRQWGLNEDNHWPDREAFDFEEFLGEGTWTLKRRRFFPPYAETDDEPRKCIVEVKNTELDDDWHRVGSATVRLLADRAGIYFDSADIDGTNACLRIENGPSQALQDITHVRITAIVKSDVRVVYDAPREETAGSSQGIIKTARDEEFRWVKRHSSSVYAGEGTGVVRDDAALHGPMEKGAAKLREKTEAFGQGLSLSVPWVDFTYHAGDRVSDLDGRGIAFSAKPGDDPSYPKINRVTYDFRGQQTVLDLRPARS